MSEIDQDEIEERSERYQKFYKKRYLATELRRALGRDEPIKSLDMALLSELLATIEVAGVDQREEDTHCSQCGAFLSSEESGTCQECSE